MWGPRQDFETEGEVSKYTDFTPKTPRALPRFPIPNDVPWLYDNHPPPTRPVISNFFCGFWATKLSAEGHTHIMIGMLREQELKKGPKFFLSW